MKTNSRMRLTLAALVLATFAGSLTGQAGDGRQNEGGQGEPHA